MDPDRFDSSVSDGGAGALSAYWTQMDPDWFAADLVSALESGGDDETRTRDLCRSQGCRHFRALALSFNGGWGVCTNNQSPRAGLLTFHHQGCASFEPSGVASDMTDAQLRRLIGEASQILEERRTSSGTLGGEQKPRLPAPSGEFFYNVKTSYFPHIKGHRPRIVRLEPHENGFVPVELNATVRAHKRPGVIGRFAAKNGGVFKVVRENGKAC
jgi:hypothetical protein